MFRPIFDRFGSESGRSHPCVWDRSLLNLSVKTPWIVHSDSWPFTFDFILKKYLGLEFGYPLDPYLVEHYYPNRSSFHSYHSVSPTVHSNLSDNMPDSCSSPDSHYSQSHSPNSNCTSLVLTQSSRTRQSRRPSADLDKKRIHKCSYEGTFTFNNIFRKYLWLFWNYS